MVLVMMLHHRIANENSRNRCVTKDIYNLDTQPLPERYADTHLYKHIKIINEPLMTTVVKRSILMTRAKARVGLLGPLLDDCY